MIKTFREGVVDGEGGGSERYLRWSGGVGVGVIKGSFRKHLETGGWSLKANVVRKGEGVLKVSPPLPPRENFNHTLIFRNHFIVDIYSINIIGK